MMSTVNAIDGRLDALEAKIAQMEAPAEAVLAVMDAKRAGDKERFVEAKATLREILDGQG